MTFDWIVFFALIALFFFWCCKALVNDHAEQCQRDRLMKTRMYASQNPHVWRSDYKRH